MLRFLTNEQIAAHNAPREAFDRQEEAISRASGGRVLIGNAAPIGLDAWRRIDARASRLQRDELAVYARLARANSVPVDIGDLVSFSGTPVPIIHSEAGFGWRQWAVLAKGGGFGASDSLANNQRIVIEKLEDMAINGLSSIVVGGATIYGLKTFPDRSSSTYGAFNLNGGTGANWATAITTTINLLVSDNSFGNATVFVNYADWMYAGQNDFAANYPKTILQRMLEMPGVREIIPCSKLAANDVIAVNNVDSGEWGSILTAMPVTTRPKARLNEQDDYNFSVMAATAPQFRSDANSRSHIAVTTRT